MTSSSSHFFTSNNKWQQIIAQEEKQQQQIQKRQEQQKQQQKKNHQSMVDTQIESLSQTLNNQTDHQIKHKQQEQQQLPLLMQQQNFQQGGITKLQQFLRQKQMMQIAAKQGKRFLMEKQYLSASKQLSKALMAFQFIAKNHAQTIPKQQIKNIMISTVLPTYNNLSLCYLKLKNYPLVISFTNQILGQDSGNVKARYRRAIANKELKNIEESISDFEVVKKIDTQMENDCNYQIGLCKAIQLEQRKRRKVSAQKFIAGYERQGQVKRQQKQTNSNARQFNMQTTKSNKKYSILSWLRDKCQRLTRLLPKWRKNQQQNQTKSQFKKNQQ